MRGGPGRRTEGGGGHGGGSFTVRDHEARGGRDRHGGRRPPAHDRDQVKVDESFLLLLRRHFEP